MRQLILEKQNIKNGLIVIEGKDFRYLRQVLRVKVGDMISVRLPKGTLENSTVAQVDDKSKKITLQICAKTDSGAGNVAADSITRGVQATEIENSGLSQNGVEYWLFQFLPKPQKFELIVRQATECGISKIIPIIGEYTEKSSVYALQGNKKERIERIVKEARQQSGSPIDTKVLAPMSLEEALEMWGDAKDQCPKESSLGFVLSERDDCSNNLHDVIEESKSRNIKIEKIGIGVGSEGGLSPEEVTILQEKGLFYPIHFAVNILRCETAALYGIAAVQSAVN